MKRILCFISLAVFVCSLAACGEPEATEPPTGAPTEATEAEPTESEGEIDLKAFIKDFDTTLTMDESVIYDDQDVTVTMKGISYDPISGPQLTLFAENSSEKNVTIQSGLIAVNGYMLDTSVTLECPAGKSAEGLMEMSYRSLALAGISMIARVEFTLRVLDSKSYEQLAASAPIILTTSADDSLIDTVDDSGQTVYHKNDVRIVLKGIDERRMYTDGTALIVYMENSTDRNICIQTGEIKVNGYDFTSAMTSAILPGKKAVGIVTFFDMDMQEYGVSEIDSVELNFKIIEEETWKTIDETEMIDVEIDKDEEE